MMQMFFVVFSTFDSYSTVMENVPSRKQNKSSLLHCFNSGKQKFDKKIACHYLPFLCSSYTVSSRYALTCERKPWVKLMSWMMTGACWMLTKWFWKCLGLRQLVGRNQQIANDGFVSQPKIWCRRQKWSQALRFQKCVLWSFPPKAIYRNCQSLVVLNGDI